MLFHLQAFKVHRLVDNAALLYTARGSAEITNRPLIDFLSTLEVERKASFSYEELRESLINSKLKPDDAINFLTNDILLFRRVPDPLWRFKRILLIAPGLPPPAELLNELASATACSAEAAASDAPIEPGTFVVVYLEQYDPETIRGVYRRTRTLERSAVLTSYVLERTFFIDGIYFPAAYVPCHFCHVDRLRATARLGQIDRQNNWFAFYNYLEERRLAGAASLPISPLDRSYAYHLLRTKVREVIGVDSSVPFPSEVLSYFQADLDSGEIERDVVPLWDCCACLTQSW